MREWEKLPLAPRKKCAGPLQNCPGTRPPPLRSDRSAQLGKAISASYTAFREILDNPIRRGIVNFWIEERLHGSSLEQTGTYRSSPPQSACTDASPRGHPRKERSRSGV